MYIPQSTRDKFMIECIRNQTFSEIQNHPHFQVIKDQFIEGVKERRILTKIISDIGHQTKDWGLYNILMYYHQIAWEQASAMEIRKRNEGKDVLVYKNVHSGCCEECIKLFLTNGVRSHPKTFLLSVIEANGSNIGKDNSEWKPSILPIHYGCECSLHQVPEGFIWNTDTQSFSTPDPDWKPVIINRKKIKVTIGDKTFFV